MNYEELQQDRDYWKTATRKGEAREANHLRAIEELKAELKDTRQTLQMVHDHACGFSSVCFEEYEESRLCAMTEELLSDNK